MLNEAESCKLHSLIPIQLDQYTVPRITTSTRFHIELRPLFLFHHRRRGLTFNGTSFLFSSCLPSQTAELTCVHDSLDHHTQ
jgi:hypothetical protein